jgi:hypothetical protein
LVHNCLSVASLNAGEGLTAALQAAEELGGGEGEGVGIEACMQASAAASRAAAAAAAALWQRYEFQVPRWVRGWGVTRYGSHEYNLSTNVLYPLALQ